MTNKRVDLKILEGKDFDMEFASTFYSNRWVIGTLKKIYVSTVVDPYVMNGSTDHFLCCRPRLNKEQVLLDCSQLPDGIVWEVMFVDSTYFGDLESSRCEMVILESKAIRGLHESHSIMWINPIGLHPDYAEQAKEWGYPVVEL